MSNGIKYFVTFALGAAVGSVAAWGFLKSRYEQLARDEIEEVRDYYRQKGEEVDSEQPDPEEEYDEEADAKEYQSLIKNYTEQEGGSEIGFDEAVRVVSPEDFAAFDEYQMETLTYYADGTLADDFNNPIEDVPGMVGDALDHFGDYDGDDDVIHVINDNHKCSYEICKDVRTFDQARSRILNLVEDD